MRPLAVLLLLLLACSPAWSAIRFTRESQWIVPENQTESTETWALAGSAFIEGTFEQDLFLAAETAALNGRFDRDLWCAAQTIAFSGACGGNLRLLGRTLTLDGEVARNILCAAMNIDFKPGASAGSNVHLAGEDVLFRGQAEGDVTLVAARATISGNIHGNLKVIADEITVLPGARIARDFEYARRQELILDPRVELGGELIRLDLAAMAPERPPPSWRQRLLVQAYFLLAAFLVGIVLLILAPVSVSQALAEINAHPIRCLLTGLLALLLIPSLAIVLALSLIGLPLAALLLMLYAGLLYSSKILTACFLGTLLLRSPRQGFGQVIHLLAIGLLLIYAAALLPGSGFLVWLLSTALGLGGLIIGRHTIRKRTREAILQMQNED